MAARHPLPYGFAKAHTLLLEDFGHERVLWTADGGPAAPAGRGRHRHDRVRAR